MTSEADQQQQGGWITDPTLCPYIGQRIRRPIPPPFCDAVDIVGSLPVTVENVPYRPTVHVSVGEGEFATAAAVIIAQLDGFWL